MKNVMFKYFQDNARAHKETMESLHNNSGTMPFHSTKRLKGKLSICTSCMKIISNAGESWWITTIVTGASGMIRYKQEPICNLTRLSQLHSQNNALFI